MPLSDKTQTPEQFPVAPMRPKQPEMLTRHHSKKHQHPQEKRIYFARFNKKTFSEALLHQFRERFSST